MIDILSYLSSIRSRVDLFIEQFYSEKRVEIPERLYEALNYAVSPGGKMLRPAVAFGICEEMGADTSAVLPVASAIELIHTFSLIHDDLPCMDNADYRRGRETVHKRFSESIALLCGDALLADAFGMIARIREISEAKRVQISDLISSCIGSYGMIGGQVLDIEYSSGNVRIDPFHIITLKTAKMFVLSSICGAICSGKDFENRDIVGFGEDFGILFQLTDDILDFQQDRKGSFNMVALKGHREIFQEIEIRYQKIKKFVSNYRFNQNIISGLTDLVMDRIASIRETVEL